MRRLLWPGQPHTGRSEEQESKLENWRKEGRRGRVCKLPADIDPRRRGYAEKNPYWLCKRRRIGTATETIGHLNPDAYYFSLYPFSLKILLANYYYYISHTNTLIAKHTGRSHQ